MSASDPTTEERQALVMISRDTQAAVIELFKNDPSPLEANAEGNPIERLMFVIEDVIERYES